MYNIQPCFDPQKLPSIRMTEKFSMRPITESSLEQDAQSLIPMLMFDQETKKYMNKLSGFEAQENIPAYLFNSYMTQSMGISFTYTIRYNAGICGLIKATSPAHNKVTNNFDYWMIDYLIIPPFRGHKIMKSALPIVFDIMKNRLGIQDPVYAMVYPDHEVSIHLLELNGFQKDPSMSNPIDRETGMQAVVYKKNM